MAFSRYNRSNLIAGGRRYGTNYTGVSIYRAVKQNRIKFKRQISKEGDRLDILAGKVYGDSKMWWVIAAASGIGWCLQVPSGTVLTIPLDLGEIEVLTT